ncbi:MAG: formimidoylglutamate deiminase [Gammaproteobacteria bacterium]|nr:formimidoylglutamate deiminase [Gammaproteobacteria bacterium]
MAPHSRRLIPMKCLFSKMLTNEGWAHDALVQVDRRGMIVALHTDADDTSVPRIEGVAIPGIPNAHSHAHQRLLAGLAESGAGRGDFMRWRELMYRAIGNFDPDSFEAVAALAYMEMLKAGYTSVAEFHYLHHDVDGSSYSQPAEMGLRCLAAARDTGIAVTLLPVLYAYGGFGACPPDPGQSRFVCDADGYMDIFVALCDAGERVSGQGVGFAPHSLRAVDEGLIRDVLTAVRQIEPAAPAHIHVAEQRSEVEACLAWCGARPVQRLLDEVDIDSRWNLVHATHMNESEREALAATGATVVVCPTTEANLGDGVFGAREWLELDGSFAVGSDSQISISPADELRLLEYAQRLVTESRLVLLPAAGGSVGRFLLDCAWAGGAASLGQPCGTLAEGARADVIVLDEEHPALVTRSEDDLLDAWVFSGGPGCVRHVFVGGRQVVDDHRHVNETSIINRYRDVAECLLQ